ncbi:MAG: hypothetical protein AAGF10_02520, partial [Verrucomicrobiota bacterium]
GTNTGFTYPALDFSLSITRGGSTVYEITPGSIPTNNMQAFAEYVDRGNGQILSVMSLIVNESGADTVPDGPPGPNNELTGWGVFVGDLAPSYSQDIAGIATFADQGVGTPLFTSEPTPGDATTLANLLATSGFDPDFNQGQVFGDSLENFILGGGIGPAIPEPSSSGVLMGLFTLAMLARVRRGKRA